MSEHRREVGTDAALMGMTLIWGVNFSVVKLALASVEPFAFNALRFPLAAATLWLFVWLLPGRAWPDRADLPRIFVLALLGNVVYQLCFIVGIDLTLAGNASLLLATTPVWTLLFSAAVGHERPTAVVVLGVLATIVGIALVVVGSEGPLELGGSRLRGDALMLLAAVLWSIYTVGAKSPIGRYGPLRVTAWTLWLGTPFLVALGIPSLSRTTVSTLSPGVWAAVVYAGVFSIGVAYLIWYRGVQRLGNSRTAVYSNVVPVAALLVAWIWLGEAPTGLQLLGAAIILAGVTATRAGAQSPGRSSFRWRISGNS